MEDVFSEGGGSSLPAPVIYDRLVHAAFPAAPPVLFGTACVLGGSVAGLLTAAVLARFSRQVVIIERDDTGSGVHPGVPHDQQLHAMLPSGRAVIDRLLPGFTETALKGGASLIAPRQNVNYVDDVPMPPLEDYPMLSATRPLLENSIRALVLAHANIGIVRGRVTGLRYADGGVAAVRYTGADGERTLPADFAVDAMGASSRLPAWLAEDGYDQPAADRVPCGVTYATAYFKRAGAARDLPIACTATRHASGKTALAAALAIEDSQWSVAIATYDGRPPGTAEEFRAACAPLPAVYGDAVSGVITRDTLMFSKAHNIRRDFTGLRRFPSRLVAVGDSAASFNPIYGQGMSSAALQAAALSGFLAEDPDLTRPATAFFEHQEIVVDAAWATATGDDAARADMMSGAEVPEDVRRQRWAVGQIVRASLRDPRIAREFLSAAFMLTHPDTLSDPDLLDRAIRINA